MLKHLSLYLGIAAIFGGLTLFAVSVASDDASTAYGQDATATAADGDDDGTTTPDADTTGTATADDGDDDDDDGTRTPGPLTPVATPTTGGGAGGAVNTPVAGGAAGLPDTGMGTSQDTGFNWIALAGMLVAVAGGGVALAGVRRR